MKSLKLLLKTLSIAALLAFANNGLVIASDAANAQAEAAAEPVAKKEKDEVNHTKQNVCIMLQAQIRL